MIINKIFLDANILLDMIDKDRGNIEKSRDLIYRALMKDILLFTSCDILSNVYYVANRKLEKVEVIQEIDRMLEIFDIVPIDNTLAQKAMKMNVLDIRLDFEDLLQSVCAEEASCDLIVTNDKQFVSGLVQHVTLDKALELI
ncbi:MAG: PIN domain-containing protein [Sulfurovum sp.]|nr:PIN domain-containing protein [Sulfurovum sp.]